MTESSLIQLAVVLLFLPLFGFILSIFLGKKIKQMFWVENLIIFLGLAGSIVLAYYKLSFFDNKITGEFTWIDLSNSSLLGAVKIELGSFD